MKPRPSKHGRRHRGVTLLKPDPVRRIGWRIRYKDPDSARLVKETLPELAARTRETREDFSAHKSRALEKRKLELAQGAARATGTLLSDAIDGYYEAHPRLRAKTLAGYKAATAKLLHWASKSGIKTTDQLTRAKLMILREQLVTEPKRTIVAGAGRGTRAKTEAARSEYSVNRELGALRAVLGYLEELDLLSGIRGGELKRVFKKLPLPTVRIEYLKPDECTALLEAALAHDAAVHTATREEHAGRRPRGTTPKYEPVAPMVVVALLGGLRLGEILRLSWGQVDFAQGQIHLGAEVKTAKARSVDWSVAPGLGDVLLAVRGPSERTSGRVFRIEESLAGKTVVRLKTAFGAPSVFSWQVCRHSTSTYLNCAAGIYGGAAAFRAAKQLGHSIAVSEARYAGLVKGIPSEARTLERAMGVEAELDRILEAAKVRGGVAE